MDVRNVWDGMVSPPIVTVSAASVPATAPEPYDIVTLAAEAVPVPGVWSVEDDVGWKRGMEESHR